MRHTSSCASRWYLRVPLHTGQASISSSRGSIGALTSGSCTQLAEHPRAQGLRIRIADDGADGYVPEPRAGEWRTFYGILLRHEDRELGAKGELVHGKGVMIRKGMRDHLDALSRERA